MAQIKILDVRKFPSMAPGRRGLMDTLFVVELDGKAEQRFAVTVPSETYSDADILAAVRLDLENRKKTIGRTLTI